MISADTAARSGARPRRAGTGPLADSTRRAVSGGSGVAHGRRLATGAAASAVRRRLVGSRSGAEDSVLVSTPCHLKASVRFALIRLSDNLHRTACKAVRDPPLGRRAPVHSAEATPQTLRPQMAARSLTFPQDDPQPKPHGPIPIGKRLGGVAHAAIVPPSSGSPRLRPATSSARSTRRRHRWGCCRILGARPQRLPPRPGVWDEPPRPLRRFLVEMAPEDVNACVCPPDQPRLVRMELQLQPLQDTTDALLRRYRLLRRAGQTTTRSSASR